MRRKLCVLIIWTFSEENEHVLRIIVLWFPVLLFFARANLFLFIWICLVLLLLFVLLKYLFFRHNFQLHSFAYPNLCLHRFVLNYFFFSVIVIIVVVVFVSKKSFTIEIKLCALAARHVSRFVRPFNSIKRKRIECSGIIVILCWRWITFAPFSIGFLTHSPAHKYRSKLAVATVRCVCMCRAVYMKNKNGKQSQL